MDAQTLKNIMEPPGYPARLSLSEFEALLPAYEAAMREAEINNTNRAAMWAAQLGHECVGLSALEEYASGAAYEGDADLGNTQPGDGVRYKGRGAIMVTGRHNYRSLSRWAHAEGLVPTPTFFEDNPEELQADKYAFTGAIWYWTVARPDINALSDAGDLVQVTRRINGGTNGIQDRRVRYNNALRHGEALLPSGGKPARRKPHEYLMDYSRDRVGQLTPWNCGPASVETAIQAATGRWVPEEDLAAELGTHRGGTDWIGQFPEVLNRHIPGAEYRHTEMPNDPPTAEQKEALWDHIVRSWRAGHPVIANIVAPPSNYPRSVAPSAIDLAYSGGTVYHYVSIMGYAGEGANRRVWWADSGFSPFGAWIGFDQTATLIPPKGYAWSDAEPKQELIEIEEEITVDQADRIIRHVTDFIKGYIGPIGSDVKDVRQQLTGGRDAGEYPGWPQLGKDAEGRNLTLTDGVAATRQDNADLARRVDQLEDRLRRIEGKEN